MCLPSSFIDIIKNINPLKNFVNVIPGCCEDVKGHVVAADLQSPFCTQGEVRTFLIPSQIVINSTLD